MAVMTPQRSHDNAESRIPTREKFELAQELGKKRLQELAAELKALGLPKGSTVIVNVTNGAYVAHESRKVALEKYC